jgi:glyceraldehyde 3-phosphate dehydrogenase
MSVRVAINGLGRTGRSFLRSAYARDADIEVVAVNDLADAATLAYLLKYDSVGGRFPGEVRADPSAIVIDERPIQALAETDPSRLPWADLGIDVVIESTGHFRTRAAAARHLERARRWGLELAAWARRSVSMPGGELVT